MNLLARLFGLSPVDYNEWELRWLHQDGNWIFILIALLILPALWFFWSSLRRISFFPKKLFLFFLRLSCFALLILVLLHPEIEFRKSEALKNSIAVLLDDSMSMSIKASEKQRIDLVRDILKKKQDFFEALKENFQVDYYFVSDRIAAVPPASIESKYRSHGANTDLNKVLLEIRKQYEGKSLTSVMLFSDGADLAQEPPEISTEIAETLARFNAPINTFQAGANKSFRDLGIEYVEKPDFGFVQQPVNLSVTLTASLMGNKHVPLVLRKDGKILVSKIVDIKEDQSRYKVDLQFTPTLLGRQIYSLSVPLFADEAIEVNNSRDFQINVVRDRVRILHLNGRPSWDSRYLREVLVNNPKVDLLSFFILRTLSDDVEATTGELSLIPFPSNLLFTDYLNSFDIIIFQNFQYSPFVDKKYLQNIKDYVDGGGAFMMVGGDLSFQGGGYENTPIAELLPVSLKSMGKSLVDDEFQFQAARDFVNHPILRLEKDDESNRSAWKSMSPLNGLNIGLVPKKNAQVLSSFSRNNGSAYPVLVVGKEGKGRSLVLATDTSWNWNFRRVGKGGSGRYYQKFWNNVISWMIADPETHTIHIDTDKGKYGIDEKVLIKFKVLQENFNPWPDKKIRLTVYSSPGKKEVLEQNLETDKSGEGSFQFFPAKEGFYWVRLEVKQGNETQANEVGFSVFNDTAEFQKPMINSALLEAMAKTTGGVFQVLDDSTDMDKLHFPNPKVYVNISSRVITLWDNWWSYGFLLAALCFDWLIRRKSGLS